MSTSRQAVAAGAGLWLAALLGACGDGGGGNPADSGTHLPAAAPGAQAGGKLRGVNLDVSRQLPSGTLDELVEAGVAWVALVPFGWQPRYDAPRVQLRTTGVRWGETDSGLAQVARQAGERGLRVLLKPHIWLVEEVPEQWQGTIGFDNESDWLQWEADYRLFLLHYAQLAADMGADMFSVGVELHRCAGERPAFWRALIDEVRQVYPGPLTYGANWYRELEDVEFWDRLDYIGVHAYFPLTDRLDATVGQLEQGWQPHIRSLEAVCHAYDRPVLFTEVGYRSIAGAAVEPWNFTVRRAVDGQEQADAYEALFRALWGRPWFAGLFLWEWDADVRAGDRLDGDDGYTPQNKPALAVLTRWFAAPD